jgi:hypothetical protein
MIDLGSAAPDSEFAKPAGETVKLADLRARTELAPSFATPTCAASGLFATFEAGRDRFEASHVPLRSA